MGIHHEEGYALTELIVGLFLTTLVMGGLLGTYQVVDRAMVNGQRQVILQNHLHRIPQRWADDLTYTTHFIPEADTAWTLYRYDGHTVRYVYRDSLLFRNQIRMLTAPLRVTRFRIHTSRPETQYALLQSERYRDNERNRLRFDLAFTLQGWHFEKEIETRITSRSRRPWPPIP